MTVREFPLPDLGEGLTEAEVVRWLVAVGDQVTVDQPVVEVETAKAIVELPTPYAGTVTALPADAGQVVDVGATLIVIDDRQGAEASRYVEEERAGSGNVLVGYGTTDTGKRRRRSARRPAKPPASPPASRPRVISPVVRRLAREHTVDLTSLSGSGPGGVITRTDVQQAIDKAATPVQAPVTPEPAATPQPIRERIPLRGARKTAAEAFTRSRREIPEATTWVDVDATGLVELRAELNAGEAPPIGLLALIARFVIAGLTRYPALNSRVDTALGEILVFDGVNLGFAAQTGHGLVVPVVKDAHRLSAAGIHTAVTELTGAARDNTLKLAQLTGGTFTLNNYGVFGVDGAAPIINHPEAAILGVGRIIDRPWVVDGDLTVRKITQLSLAFDHRVCDGGTAAAFLRLVADCVQNPKAAITAL